MLNGLGIRVEDQIGHQVANILTVWSPRSLLKKWMPCLVKSCWVNLWFWLVGLLCGTNPANYGLINKSLFHTPWLRAWHEPSLWWKPIELIALNLDTFSLEQRGDWPTLVHVKLVFITFFCFSLADFWVWKKKEHSQFVFTVTPRIKKKKKLG